jgi:cytochrome b
MSLMHKIRVYHAALAILTLLAYFTGDFDFIHDWLGYAVGVIIVARLGWAVFNPRQLASIVSIRCLMGSSGRMLSPIRR